MQAIVAADNNWGIGYQNRLLVSIPSDMKFFRQKTTGNVVVMGRKTLESFPNGLPLKNRVNIVLTKNKNYQVKDAVIVHSEEELLEELKKYPSEKIYVIGGESIYKMMLPYCDTIYVTKRQGCRKEEKICLKTNLHLSTKRQQQQSETSRTSSGCTGRQGHCRRSALLSHPALMPREKDSEKCLCSDKEEEKMCKKMRNLDKLRLMPVEDLVPLLVHKTGSGFYCSPSGKEYPAYKDAADDCVCWLNADVCMIR